MNIPRYTLKALPYEESDEGAAGAVLDTEPSANGEWCKWEDVQKALRSDPVSPAQVAELKSAIEAEADGLRKMAEKHADASFQRGLTTAPYFTKARYEEAIGACLKVLGSDQRLK